MIQTHQAVGLTFFAIGFLSGAPLLLVLGILVFLGSITASIV